MRNMISPCCPEELMREVQSAWEDSLHRLDFILHVDSRLPRLLAFDPPALRDLFAALFEWVSATATPGSCAIAIWRDDATDPAAVVAGGPCAITVEAARTVAGAAAAAPILPPAIATASAAVGGEARIAAEDDGRTERIAVTFAAEGAPGARSLAARWGTALRGQRVLVPRHALLDPARFAHSLGPPDLDVEIAEDAEDAIRRAAEASENRRPFDIIALRRAPLGPRLGAMIEAVRQHDPDGQSAIAIINGPGSDIDKAAGADLVLSLRGGWSSLIDSVFDLVQRRAEARAGGRHRIPSYRDRHILIAEDVTMNQMLIQAMLAPTGATCEIASNGSEAVEAMCRHPADLIIMDIQMPVMDGLEAARRIRKFATTVPIVALTAHAGEADRNRYLASGMEGYLAKPVRVDDLFAVIDAALAARDEKRRAG